MAKDDPNQNDKPEEKHPIDPPVKEEDRYRLDSSRKTRGQVTDVGRTSGGGNLGHVQPDMVEREAPSRNNADERGSDEPTLPSKESSLNTKI